MENVMTASQSIGKIIYEEAAKSQAAAGGGPGAPGGEPAGEPVGAGAKAGGKKDDDVIDAEYEVKE